MFSLPAQIAVVTNVELDHHRSSRRLRELKDLFDGWLKERPTRRTRRRRPYAGGLALPGEQNRVNAGAALRGARARRRPA